jgi:hypothetical protein
LGKFSSFQKVCVRISLSRIVFWIVFRSTLGLYGKMQLSNLICPSLYSSRYSRARSIVAWRFHGHLPSGLCQLYCTLQASGPVRTCFSMNCLTWIAGAQGGNGGTGRPCSSFTITLFFSRKARSGAYRHFDQYSLWRVKMKTDPKNLYLLPIFPATSTLTPFILVVLVVRVIHVIWLLCFFSFTPSAAPVLTLTRWQHWVILISSGPNNFLPDRRNLGTNLLCKLGALGADFSLNEVRKGRN